MYNTKKLIEEGREIMHQNPERDITGLEIKQAKEAATDDYTFAENMFFMGLAIGARIGKNN